MENMKLSSYVDYWPFEEMFSKISAAHNSAAHILVS